MKNIIVGSVELITGIACIGFLLYEFIYLIAAPFINGGYLPSLTYSGLIINTTIILYLTFLENKIFE